MKPYNEGGGTPYFPSGLTERSGNPELTHTLGQVEKALDDFDYQGAVKIAATQMIGMISRLQAIGDLHRIQAINARRNGDGEKMIQEMMRMRQALDAVGLPYKDPIEDYHERCRKNSHIQLPLYEEKK